MEPLGTTEPKFKYIDTNLPLYNLSSSFYYLLSVVLVVVLRVNYSFYTLPYLLSSMWP
jgi:hypothetical protein